MHDFLYESERQSDVKDFQKEENREGVTSADLASEETRKKVAYATGFLENRDKTN